MKGYRKLKMKKGRYAVCFDGRYVITDEGDFYKAKILPLGDVMVKPMSSYLEKRTGHIKSSVSIDGKRVTVPLAKLVAKHFIRNPRKRKILHFKDGDKTNIAKDNLQWGVSKPSGKLKRDRRYREIPEDLEAACIALYDEGKTRWETAEELEMKYATVAAILRRNGRGRKSD